MAHLDNHVLGESLGRPAGLQALPDCLVTERLVLRRAGRGARGIAGGPESRCRQFSACSVSVTHTLGSGRGSLLPTAAWLTLGTVSGLIEPVPSAGLRDLWIGGLQYRRPRCRPLRAAYSLYRWRGRPRQVVRFAGQGRGRCADLPSGPPNRCQAGAASWYLFNLSKSA